jgi:SPP1 family predicted phage head-tail adaptor
VTLAAGDLSRFLRIQRRQAGVDSLNRPLTTWEPVVGVWGQPRGRTGMGTIRAQEEGVPADVSQYSFRIRYRPNGLDAGMRIAVDERVRTRVADADVDTIHTRYYEITNITHDLDRREWTDLVCRAGAADG